MISSTIEIPDRLIAIGDIHGENDKLRRLLNWVAPTHKDQLVFLGDYIDRGPDSRGVIERLIEIQRTSPRSIFLRGNHDQLLLDALVEAGQHSASRLCDQSPYFKQHYESATDLFFSNGGWQTLKSYAMQSLADPFPAEHLNFIESTRLWWRHEDFLFVHAGLAPGIPVEQQDPGVLLWERFAPGGNDGTIHVVGHQVQRDGGARFDEGKYWLDTGAVYGMKLTACDVLTQLVWQTG
jgi:serine/threonine protein phosphatase 1